MWETVHIPIPRRRNRKIAVRDQTKARSKSREAEIKSYNSIFDTQCHEVSSQVLGKPCPCGLASCNPHSFSYGLALYTACTFLQWTSNIYGISNFLGSLLQFHQLYALYSGGLPGGILSLPYIFQVAQTFL